MTLANTRRKRILTSVSAISLFAPLNAYAYLDPGTGSILLQGLIAAIAGVAVTGRLYWSRIKSILGFGPKASEKDEANEMNDKRDER
jgi:hypothetical protein